jgi:hypothetical protein
LPFWRLPSPSLGLRYPFSFLIYFFFWHILAYIDRSVFLGCIFELYRDVCDGSWRVLCPSWWDSCD